MRTSMVQAAQQLRDECHAFLLGQLPAEARAAAEVAAGHVPLLHSKDSMQIDSTGASHCGCRAVNADS